MTHCSRRARRALLALLAICGPLLVAPSASAQGSPVTGASDTVGVTRPSSPATLGPLLDAPVSRADYRLGPGDVLDIGLVGDINRVHTVVISPEGSVLVPGIGVARVLGVSLDQAEARVRQLVARQYRNVGVSVALAQVRAFKVFVVGDVPNPGVRAANAATRVSEVIPADTAGRMRRNVLVRRASGDTVIVDLARFRQTGDLSANPSLREGDAVVVPTVDRTVEVFGRAHYPGTYEFRGGESLAGLLEVANGARGFPTDAADTIRVTRFTSGNERTVAYFTQAEAAGARGRAFVLAPFDAIYIAAVANFRQQKTARIEGQVQRPGVYPIRPDTTTIRDLVAMAGGFTSEASLVMATLRRQPLGRESVRAVGALDLEPELLTESERRIQQIRAAGGAETVVLDFHALFAEGRDAYNLKLQNGDAVLVPRLRNEVALLGAVRRPGAVQFEPGRSLRDYVALAGGYANRADKGGTVVLNARSGTPLDASDVAAIEPGDTVIIPFHEPGRIWRRFQTTSSVVTTISGIILTIVSLRVLF